MRVEFRTNGWWRTQSRQTGLQGQTQRAPGRLTPFRTSPPLTQGCRLFELLSHQMLSALFNIFPVKIHLPV